MRRILALIWNQLIDLLGAGIGSILRAGVRRQWIHFPFASEALSRVPFSFGWKLRRAAYSRVLPRIGRDAVLHFGVILDDPRTAIGNDVWVSAGAYIDYVEIGNHVLIGPHAVLLAGARHHNIDRLDVPIKQQGNPPKKPILIEDGVWIGANATVMADVGHDAIVGAGAVVTKRVPALAIVAGNPARVIRMRGPKEMTEIPGINVVAFPEILH
jgi:acetyltransferase-like isoleucine patch superfamily enzyme